MELERGSIIFDGWYGSSLWGLPSSSVSHLLSLVWDHDEPQGVSNKKYDKCPTRESVGRLFILRLSSSYPVVVGEERDGPKTPRSGKAGT